MDPTERSSPPADAWLRAVGYAVSAPDGAEALSGILAEAGPALGAASAAVLEGAEAVCRGVWGIDAAALLPLLQPGGAAREAMRRLEAEDDDALTLQRPANGGGWVEGYERVVLVPLRCRDVVIGALALFYESGDGGDGGAAAAFAGLAALVLENDRLYEEAREARQAREHFLTALNHELRTPATAFVLTADMLRYEAGGSLPPRVQRILQETETHIHQMSTVLHRVLDLSHLKEHSTAERTDLVEPRQAVADLLRRVEPTARRKNLQLALYVTRGLPPLQTDATRFSRILLHLLSNAIRYTDHGGVEVRLERATQRLRAERPEPVLVIRVKDTGRGIPAQELQRILEPFAQVEEGARGDSRSRGLGLGLPLARSLARSLGGDIRIESTLGKGTTASLVLPYHQTSAG